MHIVMRSACEVLLTPSKAREESVHNVVGAETSNYGWDIACNLVHEPSLQKFLSILNVVNKVT